jgi:hypothetical protein
MGMMFERKSIEQDTRHLLSKAMPPDRNLNCRKCLSPRASYRNISGCEWASLEIERQLFLGKKKFVNGWWLIVPGLKQITNNK